MIDAWVNSQKRVPTLLPPTVMFIGAEEVR